MNAGALCRVYTALVGKLHSLQYNEENRDTDETQRRVLVVNAIVRASRRKQHHHLLLLHLECKHNHGGAHGRS